MAVFPTVMPTALVKQDQLQQYDQFANDLGADLGTQETLDAFDSFAASLPEIEAPKLNAYRRKPRGFDALASGTEIGQPRQKSLLEQFDAFAKSLPEIGSNLFARATSFALSPTDREQVGREAQPALASRESAPGPRPERTRPLVGMLPAGTPLFGASPETPDLEAVQAAQPLSLQDLNTPTQMPSRSETVARAQASLETEFERLQELHSEGTISLDEAKAQADAAYAQAKRGLDQELGSLTAGQGSTVEQDLREFDRFAASLDMVSGPGALPQEGARFIDPVQEARRRSQQLSGDELTAGALETGGQAIGGAIAQGMQLMPAPAQSALGTVLDVLGRPQQTIYGAARAAKRGENVLEGAGRGLTGEQHVSGSEMVREFGGTGSRTADILTGLGADLVLDPLNAVQFGAGGLVRSGLSKGAGLAAKVPGVAKVGQAAEELFVPLATTRGASPEAADLLRSLEITKRRAMPVAAREVAGEFGQLPKEVRDSLGKLVEGTTAVTPDTDVANLLHRLGVDGTLDVPAARDLTDRARTFIQNTIAGPEAALGIAPATRRNYFPRLAEAGTVPLRPVRTTKKAVDTSLKGFMEERLFPTQEAGEAAGVVYRPALEALTKRLGTSRFAQESAEAVQNLITGRVKDIDGNALVTKITAKRNPLQPGNLEFGIKELRTFQAPAEVVEDIERYYKAFLSDSATNSLLKAYDASLNLWKGSVTSIYPAFHARNALGNLFNAWLGGFGTVGPGDFLPNPALMVQRLKEARDIQTGAKGAIKAPGAGGMLSYDQVRDLAEKAGIRGSGMFGADIPALLEREISGGGVRDYVNVMGVGRRVGSAVEDNAKIGFLIDRLSKGDTVDTAIAQTRKYLFDYSELTPFEKNVMKRIVPFYTWTRKNVPLMLEAVATQPAKVAATGKVSNALSEALSGNDAITQAEAELWPQWAAEQLGIQVGRDEQGNPKILSGMGLPIEDINRVWRGSPERTLQGLIGDTAPMLKAPLEYVLDSSSFTGKHITDPSYQNYYRKASALLADMPGLRDWLELRVESRQVLNPKTGQEEERTYYSANPQRMYTLLFLPFSRALTTAQKATDPRKTAGDIAFNLASGGRVSSVDLTRATAGFGVDTAKVQEKSDKGLEDLARRFEAGRLGGKEWREIRGQILGDERAGIGALLQSRPDQEYASDPERADALRRQLMNPSARALSEYRAISPEDFGGQMDEFFQARDDYLARQTPEVQGFIKRQSVAYIDELAKIAPAAAKVEREYHQALGEYREYQDLQELTGLDSEQIRAANDFANRLRDTSRSMPSSSRSSRLAFLTAAADDPDGALAYELKERIDKSSVGKLIARQRKDFWAEHPLLQKYFGDTAIEPEATSTPAAGRGENFFDSYPSVK